MINWLRLLILLFIAVVIKPYTSLFGQTHSYNPVDYFIVDSIVLAGNNVTKPKIIYRELLFKPGDTIPQDKLNEILKKSSENLMNISLFNFVNIDTLPSNSSLLTIRIAVVERWYVWPAPIIEVADRNFNAWWEKKDWSRLNYGLYLTWNNFRGRREKVNLLLRFGYDQKYELKYSIPYINKKQTWGIGFGGGYKRNHETSYMSLDNKEVYFKKEKGPAKESSFGYFEVSHRKGIHNSHLFNLGFTKMRVNDSIILLNPGFSFGSNSVNSFFSFYYVYKSDFRDFRQYPLSGYYFDFIMEKLGFGIFDNPKVNTLSFKMNGRKYFRIKGRFYWASGLTLKVSPIKEQPYYYQRGLGYGRDYLRGYEYYVIDGQQFGILKNNLKFELLPMREFRFNFIPWEKFNRLYFALYLNAYTDVGYVVDDLHANINPLANKFQAGYGLGIDLVTYYDTVWRFEYSFNKMGEHGFFFSVLPSI